MNRILVIEDDHALRSTVEGMLPEHGYVLAEADNGGAGLELARSALPDLILSDINRDGLDGFGVLD